MLGIDAIQQGDLFGLILSFSLGLIFGSFATALTYRIPNNIPWGLYSKSGDHVHSQCVHCGYKLRALDLVPILSWLFLRGKCRSCGAPISWRYPAIELLTLILCVSAYLVFGLSVTGILIMMMTPFLSALLAIDFEYMILPNILVFIVGVLGFTHFTYRFFLDDDLPAPLTAIELIGGMIVYAGISWLLGWVMSTILKKESLGFGDVKFFAVAGLWLGLPTLPYFLILSGTLGVLLAFFWQVVKKSRVFPFGPAIIASFYILLLMNGSHLL